ncbi:hypothetical protein MKX01_025595 [Papaver californicum]|nr:hypothetical protein MKX01_025595 [Papaver californicum]
MTLFFFVQFKHITPDYTDVTTSSIHDSPCGLIATHAPYPSLPDSIKISTINCKIIYQCKNPRDNFIYMWLLMNKLRASPAIIAKYPSLQLKKIWTVLGSYTWYWKESLKKPNKVLFINFTSEEEKKKRVIEDISIKNLDVSTNGTWRKCIENKVYFRKGEIGDWKNYFDTSHG